MLRPDDFSSADQGETDASRGPGEKKIIIDEDWKSQVEREKQEAQKKAEEGPRTTDDPVLPPPTLTELASSLSLQALAAMGLLPDPLSGKIEIRLNRARHLIDTVNLLYEKTLGNLTAEEKQAFEQMLHELRLTYVEVQSHYQPPKT